LHNEHGFIRIPIQIIVYHAVEGQHTKQIAETRNCTSYHNGCKMSSSMLLSVMAMHLVKSQVKIHQVQTKNPYHRQSVFCNHVTCTVTVTNFNPENMFSHTKF